MVHSLEERFMHIDFRVDTFGIRVSGRGFVELAPISWDMITDHIDLSIWLGWVVIAYFTFFFVGTSLLCLSFCASLLRFYSIIGPGDTVSVVGKFDEEGKCVVNHSDNLVIVLPDILISGTRVSVFMLVFHITILIYNWAHWQTCAFRLFKV